MYLWNIKALKAELAADTVTEPQVFIYFLAVLTLETVLYQMTPLFPSSSDSNFWDYAGFAGTVVLTVGGTLVAYRQNGGNAGRAFLTRFFPLLWVLTIRFLVFLLPVLVLAMAPVAYFSDSLFGAETQDGDFNLLSMVVAMLSMGWLLVFYYRLAVHMRAVARGV